jgi:glycerophosphoryl diester phosphodiesterase
MCWTPFRRDAASRNGHDAGVHVTGHRGQVVCGGPAENTLAAVAVALDGGADGVEVDVRLTLDGVPVCVHDADLLSVTGTSARVSQLRYDELGQLALADGSRVARLDEVAHLVRGRGLLVVEVKHDPGGSPPPAAPVLRALSGHDERELVVSSFSPAVLADVRRRSEVRTALVTGPGVSAASGLAAVLAGGYDELHAHVSAVLADHEVVDRAEHNGRAMRCWTVNREVDARLLEVAGVAHVICDDPVTMVRALAAPRSIGSVTEQGMTVLEWLPGLVARELVAPVDGGRTRPQLTPAAAASRPRRWPTSPAQPSPAVEERINACGRE